MCECKKVKNDRTLLSFERFNMGWGVFLLKESHEGTGYAEKAFGWWVVFGPNQGEPSPVQASVQEGSGDSGGSS
jgi:hypothetical protein